jgi:GAF domain-containing protein
VSVGVAIFRYRLYDIDVILSRSIVPGVLAVFGSAGYIVVVVGIGVVLVAVGAPGSTLYWPSLVATALVAVAFQPVRRHVLRLADQLVYGNRAAPYEALATLSRRLADSPSPHALPARVAEATGRAVGAARILVRLGEPEEPAPTRTATWSDPGSTRIGGPALVLPVQDMGEQVGSIEVTMPPGRALRTFERQLLDDVAAQAGVAFRNALLETELAARVEQSEAQTAELAASRRRLLGVEDEARERLAGAIRRGVVPHLAAVDTGLSAAPADDQYQAEQLEALIAETERAL